LVERVLLTMCRGDAEMAAGHVEWLRAQKRAGWTLAREDPEVADM
jgi:hypothetical protein